LAPTIACNHQEFVIITELMDHDVGICCNDLLLWGQLGALLKLEVTDSAGQSEVAVHTAKINKATGRSDTRLLA
jgi:hypothetical protein